MWLMHLRVSWQEADFDKGWSVCSYFWPSITKFMYSLYILKRSANRIIIIKKITWTCQLKNCPNLFSVVYWCTMIWVRAPRMCSYPNCTCACTYHYHYINTTTNYAIIVVLLLIIMQSISIHLGHHKVEKIKRCMHIKLFHILIQESYTHGYISQINSNYWSFTYTAI